MQEIKIRKINEPDFSGSFEISNLGTLLVDKDMKEGLHRHEFFFLMVLEQGSGEHHIDFNDFSVTRHTVFFIRPGQVHELRLKQGSKGYLLSFNSGFYSPIDTYQKQIFLKVSQHNCYSLNTQLFSNIHSISKCIYQEFSNKSVGYNEVIRANLDILFIELLRHIMQTDIPKEHKASYEQERLEELLQLLESQICTNKLVTEYAEMLHLTPYKLNAITKNTLGKTCSQLINEKIILEAKRLLLATSNQVNEIAFQLCYEDPAYFIRFFKKHTGFTPQIFRQNFK